MPIFFDSAKGGLGVGFILKMPIVPFCGVCDCSSGQVCIGKLEGLFS